MEITVSQHEGTKPVAVIHLQGALNGKKLIAEAQKLFDAGTRDLLLDMTELTFISSAGLSALHQIARVYRGEDPSTFDDTQAMRKERDSVMRKERYSGFRFQEHVKLLNPSEAIQDVLDIVGFRAFFEIFTDLDEAIASFQ
jgi:anti-anti-sigma regulatory factor